MTLAVNFEPPSQTDNKHNWKTKMIILTWNSDFKPANSFSKLCTWSCDTLIELISPGWLLIACRCIEFNSALRTAASSSAYCKRIYWEERTKMFFINNSQKVLAYSVLFFFCFL
jgi:hypothetical protein